MATQSWSWQNLSADLQSPAIAQGFFHSNAPAEFYQDCFYTAAGVILLFCLIRFWCSWHNIANYNKLSEPARLVYVTHWAFFCIFMATTIPYSIAMVQVLFSPENVLDLLQPSTFRLITFPLAFQLCMYVFEGACRAVLRINYFLVVHHIIFCTLLVLAFQSQSLFMIKVDLIVSSFATYEFLLYAALISRKTKLIQAWFKVLMILGLSFYALTRLVQIMLLVALFVFSYGPTSHTRKGCALWWVGVFMSCALIILQLYTFVIYKSIWISHKHRLGKALPVTQQQAGQPEDSASREWGRLSEAAPRMHSNCTFNRSLAVGPYPGRLLTTV